MLLQIKSSYTENINKGIIHKKSKDLKISFIFFYYYSTAFVVR